MFNYVVYSFKQFKTYIEYYKKTINKILFKK